LSECAKWVGDREQHLTKTARLNFSRGHPDGCRFGNYYLDNTAYSRSLVLQAFVCFSKSGRSRVFALDSWTQTKVKVIERNDT
jgi:hypothetical protein